MEEVIAIIMAKESCFLPKGIVELDSEFADLIYLISARGKKHFFFDFLRLKSRRTREASTPYNDIDLALI